jgi:hypothetical protein
MYNDWVVDSMQDARTLERLIAQCGLQHAHVMVHVTKFGCDTTRLPR